MTRVRDAWRELLRSLAATADVEIDCDEFLDRVARSLEGATAEASRERVAEPVAQHAEVCPACRQELEALRALLGDA